ncbi:hypothetical protein UVI_02053370 [Ustilaginoidea virens]|uniref:DUF6987 domain-containing protein n=1 Tax=Ustilaginoidea virens TaxID=1159556 RepID=A0A1B5L0A7_USTVR|nr:hypothetical protein UVI_02053370 [Ustilaginoidea virens]
MSLSNPLAGLTQGAGKEQQQQGADEKSVPRTVAGVVNEKGEIIDKTGKVIGSIRDVKDVDEPQKLVGGVVTETGDVVSEAGDNLAKVHIDDNYTPTSVPEGPKEGAKAGRDWNVLGKAKSAMQYGQNIQNTYGKLAGLRKPTDEGEGAEKAEQIPGEAQKEADVGGRAEKPAQELKTASGDSQKEADVGGKTAKAKETTGDAQQKTADTAKGAEELKKPSGAQQKEPVEAPADKGEKDLKGVSDEARKKADVDSQAAEVAGAAEQAPEAGKGAAQEEPRGGAEPMITRSPRPVDEDRHVPEPPAGDTAEKKHDVSAVEDKEKEAAGRVQAEGQVGTQDKADKLGKIGDEGAGDKQLGGDKLGDVKARGDLAGDEEASEESEGGAKTGLEVEEEEAIVEELEHEEVADELQDTEGAVEGAAEEAGKAVDISILKGTTADKGGNLVDEEGAIIGRLVEGDAKQLVGKSADDQGRFLDDSGQVIGRAEPIPEAIEGAAEAANPSDLSILKGTTADKAGNLVDEKGDIIGRLVEGDAKQLVGKSADDQGRFLDDSDQVIGRAEPILKDTEGAAEEAAEAGKPLDLGVLKGTTVNKAGNLVDKKGDIIGRLVEGDAKQLVGTSADDQGRIWNSSGQVIGRAEPIPEDERDETAKDFAPFENFPDAVVEADGRVVSDGRQVGQVVEGDPKRLKGCHVDEDGDILDRRGNVIGRAESWDEPEAEPEPEVDQSALAGKRVNKAGNVVDSQGQIWGRVVEGDLKALIGRMCDKQGNIMSESGEVIGRAELVPEHEREGSREGPFAELAGCTVAKDGTVVTPSGEVVGRLVSGDAKVLYGRPVDEDGDVLDKNGNVLGKAERWEEPEVEKKVNPLAGRKVNREGNVVDEEGNIIGKLTSGDVNICAGKEVDDDGDVVNAKGVTLGHVSLLEDIPTESEEEKKEREQREKDRQLAGQLAALIEQSLDKLRPILKLITDKVDRAERTPKDELDEKQLVREVKPLIEDGSKILTETNGAVRGMDPDGRIQRQAKQRSGTKEATPEEHHLAEVIKELTGTVTETIDNAKRKIEGMPHAKKELNPLWALLSEPLFQIIAAVGLLLHGVLGLVGRLVRGLVEGLLGGLGLNKVLDGLGLGSITGALTGKKEKK